MVNAKGVDKDLMERGGGEGHERFGTAGVGCT